MTITSFISQMLDSPMLFVSAILTLGVIFVNGWTDAPNAIATCVSTRAIEVRKAIVMAAIFDFLGVFVMTAINSSVAFTIYNMVDFGGDSEKSLIALCAAMAAIVIWPLRLGISVFPQVKVMRLLRDLPERQWQSKTALTE